MELAQLKSKLSAIGQDHVLRFYDKLGETSKKQLVAQISALDLDRMKELVATQVKVKAAIPLPRDIKPANAYPREPRSEHRQLYQDADARGHELLKQGKVAAFLVAGGQGTRLGYDGPKGEYPVTPVKNKPLFQVFAEQLLAHSRDAGKVIPWYVMTSDINDGPTRAFFAKHKYFGYPQKDVMF